MVAPNDLFCFLVLAVGTMASLFAFFWARRLKSGDLQLRDEWDYELASIVSSGCAASGEFDVESPSATVLLEQLERQLAHPRNVADSPWTKSPAHRGEMSVLRVGDNGLSLSGRALTIGDGFVQLAPGSRPGTLRIRYALAVPSARFLATLGQFWALVPGLLASVVVPALVFLYVSGSPNPAVSVQSAQVFQAFHLVWEPYLFISLASSRIRHCGRHLEILIATVAYEAARGKHAPSG